MAFEDPYVVLGVNRGASKQDVQKAFRELALKHHPDRDPSLQAAQRFQRISRAATAILKEVSYPESTLGAVRFTQRPSDFLQGSRAPSSEAAAARQRWQEHSQTSGQQWVRSARCIISWKNMLLVTCASVTAGSSPQTYVHKNNAMSRRIQTIQYLALQPRR